MSSKSNGEKVASSDNQLTGLTSWKWLTSTHGDTGLEDKLEKLSSYHHCCSIMRCSGRALNTASAVHSVPTTCPSGDVSPLQPDPRELQNNGTWGHPSITSF